MNKVPIKTKYKTNKNTYLKSECCQFENKLHHKNCGQHHINEIQDLYENKINGIWNEDNTFCNFTKFCAQNKALLTFFLRACVK